MVRCDTGVQMAMEHSITHRAVVRGKDNHSIAYKPTSMNSSHHVRVRYVSLFDSCGRMA